MIEPLNSYIAIKIECEKEKSAGGLYVPQGSNLNATDILKEGEVVAISKDVEGLQVGDRVYYNKHSITKIPDNNDMVLVRKPDLYAILK